MEIKATTKSIRISPRKVRIVADSIRGLSLEKAMNVLGLTTKRAGKMILATLKSGVANAVNNGKLNKDLLYIKYIEVSEGSSLKRFHPSTRGRVHPYKKRSSHIRIILADDKNQKLNIKDQK